MSWVRHGMQLDSGPAVGGERAPESALRSPSMPNRAAPSYHASNCRGVDVLLFSDDRTTLIEVRGAAPGQRHRRTPLVFKAVSSAWGPALLRPRRSTHSAREQRRASRGAADAGAQPPGAAPGPPAQGRLTKRCAHGQAVLTRLKRPRCGPEGSLAAAVPDFKGRRAGRVEALLGRHDLAAPLPPRAGGVLRISCVRLPLSHLCL